MGKEGVTVRGAPGLRMFRAMKGGAVIMDRPKEERQLLIHEAVELVREEIMRVVGQKPVELPSHVFGQSGAFVTALLKAVENRSHGRVEQALVGAKFSCVFRLSQYRTIPVSLETGRRDEIAILRRGIRVSQRFAKGPTFVGTSLADEGRNRVRFAGEGIA